MTPWLRVTYLLPITTRNDRTAYLRVLNYVRTRHPQNDQGDSAHGEPTFRGFSYTTVQDDPAPIHGYYWPENGRNWIPDEIALLFFDHPGSFQEPGFVFENTQFLKSLIERYYEEEGSPQDEIWCTMQELYLI